MNKDIKDLIDMKIHERKEIDNTTSIIRVPGGVVYKTWITILDMRGSTEGVSVSSVFVPLPEQVENYED